MPPTIHQYIDRTSGRVLDERLYADQVISFLYSTVREHAPSVFRAATGRRASALLGFLNYDSWLGARLASPRRFVEACGVDLAECVDPPERLRSARALFERRIRYWECRPTPDDPSVVVSPADARVVVGSLRRAAGLTLKGKFFDLPELLGADGVRWLPRFTAGDFAVFRLTPEQYHYSHTPVAGRVVDVYRVGGAYHSCNPTAIVTVATPLSKNARTVTVLDTDVPGGTGVGHVVMIEVVALMIGDVVQRYSTREYRDPRPLVPGTFVERGCPKSLFRPGSSTDVLLFEPGRVAFQSDLLANQSAAAASRFTAWCGAPLVETEVRVRSAIARRTTAARDPRSLILPT